MIATFESIPPNVRIAALSLAVVILLLLIAPVRRYLHVLYLHATGMLDASRLSKRPPAIVAMLVGEKLSGILRRLNISIQKVMKSWARRRRPLFNAYTLGFARYDYHARRLVTLLRQRAADILSGRVTSDDDHRTPWMPPRLYTPIQMLLGLGDSLVTLLALQLFPIPYVVIVPLVLIVGAITALAGHYCGQAAKNKDTLWVVLSACIGLVICIIVGTMRFVYLSQPNNGTDSVFANAAFSFDGKPVSRTDVN